MTIKITTRSTIIPVEIDDLTFGFDTSDESIRNLQQAGQQLLTQGADLTDNDFEGAIKLIQETFDLLLGVGAGKQIYQHVGNVTTCVDVLTQLQKYLDQELQERGFKVNKAEAYIQAKHQKKQKK